MRFFDFFAGIGGFRLGMEMAGHECVGHCEIDKYADLSYRAMHHPKESEVFFDDIRTVNAADMPECECYCFGFPCQAFSIAGHRRGFDDTRGTLFFEVMRLAKERQPEILFAENVAGLLNHEGGVTFGVIISTMAELGYSVEWQVLDSQYFGVPQHRERVFIIGHLGNGSGQKIFPIGTDREQVNELQGQQNRDGIIIRGSLQEHASERTDGICPTLTEAMGMGGGQTPIISNTLSAGDRNSAGTYVADRQTDRQTDISQGKRIPQEVIDDRYMIPRVSDKVVNTICARDYKGGLYVRKKV